MAAQDAVKYFDAALARSDYYAKEQGLWLGKGAERLGLNGEVQREDFVSIAKNRVPGTDDQERLTVRDKTTRKELKVDLKTGEETWVEVANRQAGYDWTLSVCKSFSVYLAASGDKFAERIAYGTAVDVMKQVERGMECKVRGKGADGRERNDDRLTGEMVASMFVHRTTRPMGGRTDPHWHLHAWVANATFDPEEGRWKAGQFRNLIAQAAWFGEVFHHRLAENLMAEGYGIRRTDKGWEMACVTDEEVRLFSKRTRQIEDEAKVKDRKLWASARHLSKQTGMDLGDAYAVEKAKLGERTREKKVNVDEAEQREDWRQQMGAERWDGLSPDAARAAQSKDFIPLEEARERAIQHLFAQRSLVSGLTIAAEVLKHSVGNGQAEQHAAGIVHSDPRFIESSKEPGKYTIQEVLDEEHRIRNLVRAGQGQLETIGEGKDWRVTDTMLDAGQLAAVKLIMETRDRAVGVIGKPGAGKSRAIGQAADAIEQVTGERPMVLAPSARAVQAVGEAANVEDGMTVDRLMVDLKLQEQTVGRVIFCDESSFLDNKRAEWLLRFVQDRERGCRLVLWGDPRQHDAVDRGTPFADLIEDGIARADLVKIYRQKNPEILAAVEEYHAGQRQEGFDRIQAAQMIREHDSEAKALTQLVEDSLGHYRQGQTPLVIALRHAHGQAIADATRDRLRGEGLIGAEDLVVTRLERVDLSSAQRADPVCYEPGLVLQFHRRAAGGFMSGKQYEVEKVEEGQVTVKGMDGKERTLALHQPEAFQVYRKDAMPVAVGERLMVTQNQPRANLYNGDLLKVKKIVGNFIHLENGRVLDASRGLHLRQGHTVTSQASQGHQAPVTLAFLPASAENQIDGKQMLVTISRAIEELRIYTDSTAVLREAATRSGEQESAIDHVRGQRQGAARQQESPAETADLQEHAVRGSTGLDPALKTTAESAQNIPNFIPADPAREANAELEQVTGREQEPEPAAEELSAAQPEMSAYERDQWARAAAKYPVAERTPELQQKIERAVERRVRERQAELEASQGVRPSARGQGRSMTMGL